MSEETETKAPIQDETSAEEALLIALRSAAQIFNGSDKLDDKLEAFRHIASGVEGFLRRQPEFATFINPVNQLNAFMQDLCDGIEPLYLPKNLSGRPAKSNPLLGQVIVTVILDLLVSAKVPLPIASDTAAKIAANAKIPPPDTITTNPKTPAERFRLLRKRLKSKAKKNTKEAQVFKTVRESALRNSNGKPAIAVSVLEELVLPYIGGNIPQS